MFGEFDRTFCMNRGCPKSDQCGRSIKRLDGGSFLISMSSFKPEVDGTCKHELPYCEYVPTKTDRRFSEDFAMEQTIKQELKNANSLDAERK